MPRFVVTRAPGSGWELARPTREQAAWDPHATFMESLADERFVVFGGPAGTENKVVLVVDAADETTIRERLALDPWTSAGVLDTVAIEPWTIWLGGDERIDVVPDNRLFLVRYRPGPAWERTEPRRRQDGWAAHADFMDELAEQGVALLGGPLDEHRALLVAQHRNEGGLRAQLAADPWNDRVLTIDSVQPWSLWLHRATPAGARRPSRQT